jgi:hypothetical protein
MFCCTSLNLKGKQFALARGASSADIILIKGFR